MRVGTLSAPSLCSDGVSTTRRVTKTYKLYKSASVKIQTSKTAIEAAHVLLHVDNVVQATWKERRQEKGTPPEEPA
ncbi:hypothetical protein EDB83DRAFT_2353341 [Lactarius deliciosus]|nr:hypothetical protein EDB83DRAFT_2353341 [Lactarius deliciosus]